MWARDKHHGEAVTAWASLRASGARLVTTDLVLSEVVTLTRVRASFELSVQIAERLLSDAFEVVWCDRTLVDDALGIYRKYADHDLSLCDCVSFALMRRRRMTTAFAYDDDFELLGYRIATG